MMSILGVVLVFFKVINYFKEGGWKQRKVQGF